MSDATNTIYRVCQKMTQLVFVNIYFVNFANSGLFKSIKYLIIMFVIYCLHGTCHQHFYLHSVSLTVCTL